MLSAGYTQTSFTCKLYVREEEVVFHNVNNGKYYIMDLGSRNGTYVNGVRIGTNSSLEISNGSRLLLADEEFYIQITNGAR